MSTAIDIHTLRIISHNEIEYASPEHVTADGNVLVHAVLERAGL